MDDPTPVMGLEGYTPDVDFVRFRTKDGDRAIRLRGLNTEDITYLVSKNRTNVEAGVLLFKRAETALVSQNKLDDLVLLLLREAPELVAEVISVASDQPHLVETARTLPFSVQASALHKVFVLTMVEADGLKNLLASLVKTVLEVLPQALRESLSTPKKSSDGSTGESEQTSPS